MYLSDLWDLRSLTKRLYGQRIQPVCEAYGLTRMEMDILLFLANNPAFDTARDIVERKQFTKSHVSASVAELERRGYLRGEFREGNRKTVHLASVRGRNRRYARDRRPRGRFLQPCSWDSRKRNGCAWGRP